LAELPDGAGVITAEIDLAYLAKVRAELPAQNRRL
jgi:predicted amidohydrolase